MLCTLCVWRSPILGATTNASRAAFHSPWAQQAWATRLLTSLPRPVSQPAWALARWNCLHAASAARASSGDATSCSTCTSEPRAGGSTGREVCGQEKGGNSVAPGTGEDAHRAVISSLSFDTVYSCSLYHSRAGAEARGTGVRDNIVLASQAKRHSPGAGSVASVDMGACAQQPGSRTGGAAAAAREARQPRATQRLNMAHKPSAMHGWRRCDGVPSHVGGGGTRLAVASALLTSRGWLAHGQQCSPLRPRALPSAACLCLRLSTRRGRRVKLQHTRRPWRLQPARG